jgi:hydroxypyruvate reductase
MGQDRRDEPDLKRLLLDVYQETVNEMRADKLLAPHLMNDGPVHVIAIGKAAAVMARTALQACEVVTGIVVCPESDHEDLSPLTVFAGGHPMPDEQSLAAGQAIADFASSLPDGSRVLGLLSGGASALAEHLNPEWTLPRVREETKRRMESGADIAELNRYRRTVSQLKGGGLAKMLDDCSATVYVLSDVQGSDFAVIGSGPFWTEGGDIPHVLVGDASLALETASRHLEARGFRVSLRPWIGGEARDEGEAFGKAALRLEPGEALCAAGEPVVTVQGDGLGGRAQEFALAASETISGKPDLLILAAGTDGRDGPTDAAGAVVDGSSWDAAAKGDLARSDSNRWAHRAGARIASRQTDTNVNDLFLAIRSRA